MVRVPSSERREGEAIHLKPLLISDKGGLSNFSSILLTTFGYTSQQALYMNMPSGAIGLICVVFVGWISDKLNDRSSVMLICKFLKGSTD